MATLYIKSSREKIAQGVPGRDFIFIGKFLFINPNIFKHKIEIAQVSTPIPFIFSLLYGNGPRVTLFDNGLPVKKGFGILIKRPGLAFLAGKGKVLVNPKNGFHFENHSEEIPYENLPLLFDETNVTYREEEESLQKNRQRILNVLKKEFKVIDRRNGSLFLKSLLDERTWQLLFEKDQDVETSKMLILNTVNHNQWAFEYLEAKEARRRGEESMSPQDYYESLDEDSQKRKCTEENCPNVRAKGSELCKIHHYETVMGIPFPQLKN